MFYKDELVQHRHFKFSTSTYKRGLQVFASTKNNQHKFKHRKYSELVERYATPNCCIHGIHYLWSEYKRSWERYFWVAIIMLAIFGSAWMYSMIMERHKLKLIKTVVESTRLGIHTIDFPAIAVCPFNHVNTMRVSLAEERFLPHNISATIRGLFRNIANGMESLEFGAFHIFSRLESVRAELELLDKWFDITKLASFLAFRCEELFMPKCKFNYVNYDCCKIFVPEPTEKGICLVFNSLISEQSKKMMVTEEVYPRRVDKHGEGSGLKFALRFNQTYYRLGNKIPYAMNIMVKEPEEWSETLTHIVYSNTHNVFAVEPWLTVTSNNTRGMSPKARRCLFNDEKSDKFQTTKGLSYNELNCRTRCMQEYLIKTCNCTVPLFFPNTTTKHPECKSSDFICVYNNRDIFSYSKATAEELYIKDARRGMSCDCVNNCEAMNYLVNFNTVRLKNASSETITFDIYFATEHLTKYSAALERTLLDLFGSFGGTLALFLGASFISFFELIYYLLKLLFRAIADRENIWNKLRCTPKWKSSKSVKSAAAVPS